MHQTKVLIEFENTEGTILASFVPESCRVSNRLAELTRRGCTIKSQREMGFARSVGDWDLYSALDGSSHIAVDTWGSDEAQAIGEVAFFYSVSADLAALIKECEAELLSLQLATSEWQETRSRMPATA